MAGSFGFGVDLDQLAEAVEQMAQCGAALDVLLDDVSQRVDALHGTWSGAAAIAQDAAQQSWEAGFQAMRDGLAAMRAAGGLAGDSYRSAVDTNLQMWGQVG